MIKFKRDGENEVYGIEASLLPDGSAFFAFKPSLPDRSSQVGVPQQVVEDILISQSCSTNYIPDERVYVLALEYMDDEAITDTLDDKGRPMVGFKTGHQFVTEDVVLEMVLDQLMERCENCSAYHLGDDLPDEAPPAKPLLN